jgi:hypothetical protein
MRKFAASALVVVGIAGASAAPVVAASHVAVVHVSTTTCKVGDPDEVYCHTLDQVKLLIRAR